MTVKDKDNAGRVCAACKEFRLVHSTFYIVPGVVKSLCSACCRAGIFFGPDGSVRGVSDKRLRLWAKTPIKPTSTQE